MKHGFTARAFFLLLALTFIPLSVFAQETKSESGADENKDVFKNLKIRNLGPAIAGGRVTAVAGIPGNPNVYYVAGAAGGIFKTETAGAKWEAIFKKEATASIGAIALAPSNPNLIWVGTGEANVRNDNVDGGGVYFSPDAGHSWKFMGLADAGQISSVLIDPHDPKNVFVGVLGHAWGPNSERGVFHTTDGGKTWKKVLYVDDTTGVADLIMEPGNPEVLYAAMWHFRRYPWMMIDGGDSSGIYRSTDGGDTWKKLSEGLPEGPLGRIALAAAPSNPHHIYALIAAKHGMLWQSMDMGDHWTAVSDSHAIDVRPFYFSKLYVAPNDEKKIFFLSYQLLESDDGGKTTRYIDPTVHVDHHALWIDPTNPLHMIQGNDGGAYLTLDGAKTWRFLDRLPIEQFYQVAADSSEPYNLCGGLQDNSGWCGPSSNLAGRGVGNSDWYTVAGGDGEYSVPAPSDPNIIYSDSQDGFISRLDKRTHLSRFVRPTLESVEESKPADMKYRFNWTSPIAVSPTDANEVYLGGNVVFKTTDGGKNWTAISSDLTRNDKSKQEVSGEPVHHDVSGAETYDTILCITIAPTDPKVIWVGTDDGLVQVTRDGGKTWKNVAVKDAPEWARVYQVGVSPFDAGTAYVTYDAHMLDNRKAYVYKTSDYGATWTAITNGLPANTPAHVVREDPNQKGLLVLGTDTGLYYSLNSGVEWKPLKADFPTVPVYDLKFVKKSRDLVVATHGRGLFVFDDIRPLEELTSEVEAGDFHLFTPRDGTYFHHWRKGEGAEDGYEAPNGPEGVVIDYYLKSEIKPKEPKKPGEKPPVEIVVTDEHGNPVATEHGPGKAGVNRFIWSMRYDGPTKLDFEKHEEEEESPYRQSRAHVPLGTFNIAVTANGKTEKVSAKVGPDPNLEIPAADFEAAAKAGIAARNEMNALNESLNRLTAMQKELQSFAKSVQDDKAQEAKYSALIKQGKDLGGKLKALKDSVYNPNIQHEVEEDSIHELADFHDKLDSLVSRMAFLYGEAPNALYRARADELRKELDDYLSKFNALLKGEVAEYNKAAYASGAPTLPSGDEITVK